MMKHCIKFESPLSENNKADHLVSQWKLLAAAMAMASRAGLSPTEPHQSLPTAEGSIENTPKELIGCTVSTEMGNTVSIRTQTDACLITDIKGRNKPGRAVLRSKLTALFTAGLGTRPMGGRIGSTAVGPTLPTTAAAVTASVPAPSFPLVFDLASSGKSSASGCTALFVPVL